MRDINSSAFRSVIALNNIGVILLERNCFQAALLTLKESTAVIKSTLNAGRALRTSESLSSIDQRVHLAHQRLSVSHNHIQKNFPRPSVTVDVFHSNNACAKSARKLSGELRSKAFAILIEDFDFRGADANEALASTVLLNLGVAFYCVGKTKYKKGPSKSRNGPNKKYSKGAMRLFRISHALFSKQIEKKKGANEIPELLHAMALFVLSSLIIRMLYDSERPEKEARPYYSLLQHLRSWTLNGAAYGRVNGAAAA